MQYSAKLRKRDELEAKYKTAYERCDWEVGNAAFDEYCDYIRQLNGERCPVGSHAAEREEVLKEES